jgi:hypothetical protein
MTNPVPRTRSVTLSTKVSEEEYAALEKLAQARGVTVSEWCREVLLRAGGRERGGEADSGNEETLLAEVLGLRTILVNVLFGMANGERLTEEQMRKLIEKADLSKGEKAREKLGGKVNGSRNGEQGGGR